MQHKNTKIKYIKNEYNRYMKLGRNKRAPVREIKNPVSGLVLRKKKRIKIEK